MMGYGYGTGMFGGISVLSLITWLVILVDLVLLGIYLAQKISKK